MLAQEPWVPEQKPILFTTALYCSWVFKTLLLLHCQNLKGKHFSPINANPTTVCFPFLMNLFLFSPAEVDSGYFPRMLLFPIAVQLPESESTGHTVLLSTAQSHFHLQQWWTRCPTPAPASKQWPTHSSQSKSKSTLLKENSRGTETGCWAVKPVDDCWLHLQKQRFWEASENPCH